MFSALLLTAVLLFAQDQQQTGIITGAVVIPQQEISQPLQVILLSPDYADLWTSEVQKRLDRYWQQFQSTFRFRKEVFLEMSQRAHQEATNYVVTRMRRQANNTSELLTQTSRNGRFEFKNIPFGEYKVLAFGKIGDQEVLWHEFIDVRSSIPRFLELKNRVP